MKVLLVDVDSKMPNLALMKLSAHHKARGDEVGLLRHRIEEVPLDYFDKAYISCIFSKNAKCAERIKIGLNAIKGLGSNAVEIGGYGVNGIKLPDEIEHTMPDYDLYDCDFSMGFTSRGCIRNCPFCHVPKLEGGIRDHASIQEFHHPDHKKIMLLDNNFLASPKWRENWRLVLEQGLKMCMTQGFDARLITEESAELIADARSYDTKFQDHRVYTAWDDPTDKEPILRGIQRLLDAGVRGPSIIVYMLIGFNTTLEQDLYRFDTLVGMGTRPFVMPFNGRRDHPMVRWGQRPAIYMRIPFGEYARLKEAGISHPEEVFEKPSTISVKT